MAAVVQQQREVVKPATSSRTQSKLFLKRMLAISISNITYVRNIFPENVYADRTFMDMNLKILKENVHPGSKQIVNWMRGVYDALDKQYLRVLIFAIVSDKEDPTSVLESYTYGFEYEDDGTVNTNLKIGKGKTSISCNENTCEKAKQLLRSLIVLTSSLDDLPKTVYMTIRLLYYDTITPSNYQPPGFQSATSDDTLSFLSDNVRIKVGNIVTPYVSMKLRVRTEKGKLDKKAIVEKAKGPTDVDFSQSIPASKVNTDGDTSQITRKKQVPISDMEVDNQPETNSEEMSNANMSDNDGGFGVRCPCQDTEEDGVMILCSGCNYWQHAICFCLPDNVTITDKHFCHLCSDDTINICTDPRLTNLDENKQKEIACYRRALKNCLENKRVSVQDLCRKLDCKRPFAQRILEKLLHEKILSVERGQKQQKLVNKEVLNQVFQREIKHVSKNIQRQRGEYVEDSTQSTVADKENEIVKNLNQTRSQKRRIIESPLQSQLSADRFQDANAKRRSMRQKRMKLSKSEPIPSYTNY